MATKDQPEMVIVSMTLEPRQVARLRERARREDRSMSSVVRLALDAWFKAHPTARTS